MTIKLAGARAPERAAEVLPGAPRLVLLVPFGATRTLMGAGQRTRLFFDALKRLGDVHVIKIGKGRSAPAGADFPGAASVEVWPTDRLGPGRASRLAGHAYNLRRFASISSLYCPDPGLAARVEALMREGNVLVVSRYMMPLSVTALESDPARRVHVLVDMDDREDQKLATTLERMVGRWITRRVFRPILLDPLNRILRRSAGGASLVWYVSGEDVLEEVGTPHTIVPNVPLDAPAVVSAPASAGSEVLFVGSRLHKGNYNGVLWFIRTVWPLVMARTPGARFRIVGFGNWQDLTKRLPETALRGVIIEGAVDDLAQSYAGARVAICPVHEGGGSKIKIVEAAAHARPVIVSPHSVRGLGTAIAAHVEVAGTPGAMAAAIIRYLEEPLRADRDGARLRAAQQAHVSRPAMIDAIVADIRGVLAGDAGPAAIPPTD